MVVETGHASDSVAHGWAPIGSHQVALTLAPGETREVRFVLGYFENPRREKFHDGRLNQALVRPVIRRYLKTDVVEAAFGDLRSRWSELLDGLQVSTPNEHVDRMVNTWNAYQCMVTFNLSRSASYFESGIGRGMGFRDCCQDLLGFVQIVPSRARERILDVAGTQLESGGAYHQYQPLTKRGNDAVGSGFNDDPLWLVLAVAAYLKETGDRSILDDLVPFDSKPGSERPLLEHLHRSVQYTLARLGPHGLPLIGRADWNDCLNLNCFSEEPGESFQTTEHREGGVAESVFIAGLFVLAARELARDHRRSVRCSTRPTAMSDTVLAHGWDGEWFLRAYDHFGGLVGSATCEDGQIFIEPQGMCVMAGIGVEDGRAARALASLDEQLATEHGIVLLRPAYQRYHVELGEISSYPPGYKENGSVFCHTNPWVIVASTIVGDAERALEYHLRINPSAREAISDVHRSEPYVYAQTIAGREAQTFGEAKNSWLTGTAAWSYVAVTQWILGIRPEHDGLRIDPCIPASWNGFSAQRRFRGATYEITVRRSETLQSGRVTRLVVDGVELEGNVVPVAPAGATVVVEAVAQ